MSFKAKKIPKHLIIEDDYERQRPGFGFLKFLTLTALVVSLTWAVSTGIVQL